MKDWLMVDDITVCYGDVAVVKNCSFSMEKGEILSLLGASGCGKSTLLKAIAGLLPISTGGLYFANELVANVDYSMPPQARQLGMIFQDYALFPHLNVAQNVAFGLQNMDKHTRQKRIDDVLEMVRLGAYKKRYPHEISGGQQQRVALARALVREPRLLLLDEPFSNLDNEVRQRVMAEMREIFSTQDMTAIFVTHNKAEAFALADTVAVMNQGKIEQIGTPQALYDNPANQELAAFLGEGVMLPAWKCTQGWQSVAGIVTEAQLQALMYQQEDDEKITVFLRPHQLHLSPKGEANVSIEAATFLGDFSVYQVNTGTDILGVISQKRFIIGDKARLSLRL